MPHEAGDGTAVGALRAGIDAVRTQPAARHRRTRPKQAVVDFVTALDEADRVVIAANGLSAPLGLDAAMRLGAAGRPAEYMPDTLAQQIAARQLTLARGVPGAVRLGREPADPPGRLRGPRRRARACWL